MKKFISVCLVCFCLFLAGCSEQVPEENTIAVDKKGVVTYTVVEDFEKDFYDAEELQSDIEKEIADYNQKFGSDPLTLKSFEAEDGKAVMQLQFAEARYYEEYYRSSRELAHGIVVDEERKLRDGYISYLLAGKYGIRPDIYEALAGSPLRKVVKGRHAVQDGGTWRIKKGRRYSWTYSLKAPVVPGDILKVRTKKGQMYMCVEQIAYVTGEEFCADYSAVIKHMKKRLKI